MKYASFTSLNKQIFPVIEGLKQKITGLNQLDINVFSLNDFILYLKSNNNFVQKHFTDEEILYCKNNISRLAGRFASKSSIKKVLKINIPWTDIQILPSHNRQPVLTFLNNYSYLNKKNISISITHEINLIAALTLISGRDIHIAVGIDAVQIERFIPIIQNNPAVIRKIFTVKERREIKVSAENSAKKWVIKEAVSKALGVGIWHGALLHEIEILNKNDQHQLNLKGKLLPAVNKLGIKNWDINCMRDDKYFFAVILAV